MPSIWVRGHGDGQASRTFNRWLDEFVYAMGAGFDFERQDLSSEYSIGLVLTCLPQQFEIGQNPTTVQRRSDKDFESYVSCRYAPFEAQDPFQIIAAIQDALVEAVEQVPERRMSERGKRVFVAEAERAAIRFASETGRFPKFSKP